MLFANAPWIEISFVKRPIISWVVLGDEKRNEYPVDFILQYKRDGVIVHSDSVTINKQIQVRLTPQLEDITSIRLTITKWSKPNACAKILKFYDRMMERYEVVEAIEHAEHYDQRHSSHCHTRHGDDRDYVYGIGALL